MTSESSLYMNRILVSHVPGSKCNLCAIAYQPRTSPFQGEAGGVLLSLKYRRDFHRNCSEGPHHLASSPNSGGRRSLKGVMAINSKVILSLYSSFLPELGERGSGDREHSRNHEPITTGFGKRISRNINVKLNGKYYMRQTNGTSKSG